MERSTVLPLEEVVKRLEALGVVYSGKISESGLRAALNRHLDSQKQYKYYAILDFEATCLDESSNPDPQEIIEFPMVVLSSASLEIIGKIQIYVKPRCHPKLTPFCIKLTGIQQTQIDNGVSFEQALEQVEHFLFKQLHISADQMICVTCGDWDLASMMTRQCNQLGIAKPKWAINFVNIKLLCQKYIPNSRAGSLLGLLAEAGLQFEGRQHSGIVDCENIARLLTTLLTKYGAKITGPLEDRMAPLSGNDWRCGICGGVVWGSRTQCRDCKVSAPEANRVAPPPPAATNNFRQGDWYCPVCNSLNFARRDACYRKGCTGKR